jgi:hypothetical protein
MPQVTIDGTVYEVRLFTTSYSSFVQIQEPTTRAWHKLRVYAITRDEADAVYVMPIKSYLNSYNGSPGFMGALPNLVGGVSESAKNPIFKTLRDELTQETHGQYTVGAGLNFLSVLFTGRDCYAFYVSDVRQTTTRLTGSALTTSMREMTGEHLRFSAQALMNEINGIHLNDNPSLTDIKSAILRLYRRGGLTATIRSAVISSGVSALTYDGQLVDNQNEFMNRSHTIDALARFLHGQIAGPMLTHATTVRAEEARVRREAAKKAKQLKLLALLVIVILIGILFAFVM